jgi:hypothetical protein
MKTKNLGDFLKIGVNKQNMVLLGNFKLKILSPIIFIDEEMEE